MLFRSNDTATTDIYTLSDTLSLHDALPISGRTVAIKVRLTDFSTLNRSRTLPTGTDVARDIFDTAWHLYQVLNPGERIRLVGVRVEGLVEGDDAARQLALGEREHGWRDAERAADAAAARFGAVVGPASLLRGAGANDGTNGSAADISTLVGDSNPGRPRVVAERDFDPLSDPLRHS